MYTIFVVWLVGIIPAMVVCSFLLARRGYGPGLRATLIGMLCFAFWPLAVLICLLTPRKKVRYKACAHCQAVIPIGAGVCMFCSWPQPGYVEHLARTHLAAQVRRHPAQRPQSSPLERLDEPVMSPLPDEPQGSGAAKPSPIHGVQLHH